MATWNTGINVEQMREVDRLMVEEYGIALLQMMENAGRSLAALARIQLGGSLAGARIVALIGPGNNGGGGLAAARHLVNAGATVTVALVGEPPLRNEAPEHQRRILERMGVLGSDQATEVCTLSALLNQADLVLDALLGYSGQGAPREPLASFIRSANETFAPRIALDLPSGLASDTGEPGEPTLRADATLTLAWPKTGVLAATARPFVGDLYLADISVPAAVYHTVGARRGNIFTAGPIVRLHVQEGVWRSEELAMLP
jgi:NAD(P)H-hydrate epimerase